MTLPFNQSSEDDRVLHYLNLRMRSLLKTESALREKYGDDLRLSIIDKNAIEVWERDWRPVLEANPEINDRYYSTWAQAGPINIYIPDLSNPNYLRDALANCEHPEYFNVAIWKGGILCGVALGGYSDEHKRDFISIQLREGNPDPAHPLKGNVSYIINEAAKVYARDVGVSKVCYIGPHSVGALRTHENMGLQKESIQLRDWQKVMAFVSHVDTGPKANLASPRP